MRMVFNSRGEHTHTHTHTHKAHMQTDFADKSNFESKCLLDTVGMFFVLPHIKKLLKLTEYKYHF